MEDQREVNLRDVLLFLGSNTNRLIKITVIFILIGILVSLDLSNYYTSYSKMLPESESSVSASTSLLSKLGSLGGLNLGSLNTSSGTFSPYWYNDVIENSSFLWGLRDSLFNVGGQKITLKDYVENEVRTPLTTRFIGLITGFPSIIAGLLRDQPPSEGRINDPLIQVYGKEGEAYITFLKESIAITIEENMAIVISVTLPDPKLAAEVNRECILRIKTFVNQYNNRIYKQKLSRLNSQLIDAEKRFERVKREYFQFKDRNLNLVSGNVQAELELLKREYDLNFEIYGGLVMEIEQTKLSLINQSNIIEVIEPARVPAEKSGPSRTLIVIAFAIAGFFFALIYVYLVRLRNDFTKISN